jgi:DNA-binding transcriptional regulator YiaG
MTAGRPKKLTPELIEQARQHLLSFDVSIGTLLPTIEGLAIELKISRDTVYEWEKENEEFSDIVKELRSQQAQKLIQNALAGRYNASIAKLILSGKHGYVEQTELKATIEQVTPILGAQSKEKSPGDINEDAS